MFSNEIGGNGLTGGGGGGSLKAAKEGSNDIVTFVVIEAEFCVSGGSEADIGGCRICPTSRGVE